MRARLPEPRGPLVIAALAAFVTGCPNAWKLQAVDGARPTITNTTWLEIECTRQAFETERIAPVWTEALAAHFHCEGAATADEKNLCARTPGHRDRAAVEHPESLRSLTSFVDLSDAQLKEAWIHMQGPLGEETSYDGLQSASKRDDLLQQNDDAVLLAMVLGINSMNERLPKDPTLQANRWAGLPAPRAPTFVVHTGDSVDSGMFSELLQFLAAMDQLEIPYFNLVGNHDNMFFGTVPADLVSGTNVIAPYVPILTTQRFMLFHNLEGRDQDPTLPSPVKRSAPHETASRLISPTPGSLVAPDPNAWNNGKYHGFDLACRSNAAPNGLCSEARGYYAFDLALGDTPPASALPTPPAPEEPAEGAPSTEPASQPAVAPPAPPKLRVIVLNTAEEIAESISSAVVQRSRANMLPAQFEWLERQLRPDDETPMYFLVLGHHNFDSFLEPEEAERLKAILFAEPRVLAYLTAHTHVDDVVEWTRPTGEPFFEIIAGSTLVYPQLGRLIELLVDPSGKQLVLRLLTFRQALGDRAYSLLHSPDAAAGCEIAPPMARVCREVQPPSGFCQTLANRAYLGRVGAERDPDADRRDELEAVSKTNGIFPVYRFRGLDAETEYAKLDAMTKAPRVEPPPPQPVPPEPPP